MKPNGNPSQCCAEGCEKGVLARVFINALDGTMLLTSCSDHLHLLAKSLVLIQKEIKADT